jgi:hypothetical protein
MDAVPLIQLAVITLVCLLVVWRLWTHQEEEYFENRPRSSDRRTALRLSSPASGSAHACPVDQRGAGI